MCALLLCDVLPPLWSFGLWDAAARRRIWPLELRCLAGLVDVLSSTRFVPYRGGSYGATVLAWSPV